MSDIQIPAQFFYYICILEFKILLFFECGTQFCLFFVHHSDKNILCFLLGFQINLILSTVNKAVAIKVSNAEKS